MSPCAVDAASLAADVLEPQPAGLVPAVELAVVAAEVDVGLLAAVELDELPLEPQPVSAMATAKIAVAKRIDRAWWVRESLLIMVQG